MKINQIFNHSLVKKILVFLMIFNIVIPNCYADTSSVQIDEVSNIIKNQSIVFYYTSLSIVPLKILAKMIQPEQHVPGECNDKKGDNNSQDSAKKSSEFSITSKTIKLKITKAKQKYESQNRTVVCDVQSNKTDKKYTVNHKLRLKEKPTQCIVTLPRAGIEYEIIYLNRVV